MSEESVEAFATARREAQKAFNEGDFQTAFADLAPDVEWRLLPSLPDTGVLRGRDAVVDYFSRVRDAGDWRVEAVEFIDAGDGRVVIHQHGTGTGRASGIVLTLDFFQIWERDSDGLVVRVHEYERREAALEAAGLTE
jgi:ketosteroid isomerase-like protein